MSDNINNKDFENLEGQTTGHVWDGDLQEYNNPLPRWWLFAFYGTVIFAIGYWILFPTWPLPNSFTKGVYKVEINKPIKDVDGNYQIDPNNPDQYLTETVKANWSTRTRLANELQFSSEAMKRHENFTALMEMEPSQILEDPEMTKFSERAGKALFGDNCATCHGGNATGVVGMYPNLTDNAWLWGGKLENIEETIRVGRRGNMTAGKLTMNEAEIEDVARYTLTLSGNYEPDEASARGEALFYGKGACMTCHVNYQLDPKKAQGNPLMGAPDLTDSIWEIVDINSLETEEEKVAAIIPQIRDGVDPETTPRVMPAWEDRLSPAQIRALAVYVHQLGGGQ